MEYKLQLESISRTKEESFYFIFNPRLSDLFFWHFHPEYELVFITGASGSRHVGEHVSTYEDSDLVLIGGNIPHLNWDYGVSSEYRKVVVHLKAEFVENHLMVLPELAFVRTLFQQSKKGIAFPKSIHQEAASLLFSMEAATEIEQYTQLITVFQLLTSCDSIELLHEENYGNQFSLREQERLKQIYAFIDNNYHRKITLCDIANQVHLTKEAFCRYFKKTTTYTFTEFLNRYRISQAKRELMSGSTIKESCFNNGFDSMSYFNRVFNKITGENPKAFRKRYN